MLPQDLLEDLLQRCPRLHTLRLHTVCTDSLLTCLATAAPPLATLDLSFSTGVTDRGLETVVRAANITRTLARLMLEGTGITWRVVLVLLEVAN